MRENTVINGKHLVKFIIWSKCLFKAASEVRDRNAVCKYNRLIMKLIDFMKYYRKIGYNSAKATAIKLANDQKYHLIPYILILKKALTVRLWIRGQCKKNTKEKFKIPSFNYFLDTTSVSFSECFQRWKFYSEMFAFLFNVKVLEAWNFEELPKLCNDLQLVLQQNNQSKFYAVELCKELWVLSNSLPHTMMA